MLKPRWSDLDAYAHVNNVTWLEYLQEARVDMLFVHAPARGAEGLAEGVLVVRAEDGVEWLRPRSSNPVFQAFRGDQPIRSRPPA